MTKIKHIEIFHSAVFPIVQTFIPITKFSFVVQQNLWMIVRWEEVYGYSGRQFHATLHPWCILTSCSSPKHHAYILNFVLLIEQLTMLRKGIHNKCLLIEKIVFNKYIHIYISNEWHFLSVVSGSVDLETDNKLIIWLSSSPIKNITHIL